MNASELRSSTESYIHMELDFATAEPAALRVTRRVNARHVFIWPDSDSVPVLAHRVRELRHRMPNAACRTPRSYASSHASRFLLLRSLNAATSAGPGRGLRAKFAREPFRASRGEVPVC